MKTQAIVAAAGSGTRLKGSKKGKTDKPLVLLRGKPLFVHCLKVLQASSAIDSIILVVNRSHLEDFKRKVRQYRLTKVRKIVAGGRERHQSVKNGLKALDKDTDYVLVHDAARPLVTKETVSGAIKLCRREKAVVVAVPVKSTIKEVDPRTLRVRKTLKRDSLWEIQTPQVFERKLLVQAHKAWKSGIPTDDAAMVEAFGKKVKILKGNYRNIKITTPEDLILAEAFLK